MKFFQALFCWTFTLLLLCSISKVNPQDDDSQASDQEIEQQFNDFKGKFKKEYLNQDILTKRKQIFKDNYKIIKKHNSKKDKTYTMDINQFADLTNEEFKEQYLKLSAENLNLLQELASKAGKEDQKENNDTGHNLRRVLQSACTSILEYDIERPGSILTTLTKYTISDCCAACESYYNCKGWTFQMPSCQLKSTATAAAVPKPGAVSGRKNAVASSYIEYNSDRPGQGYNSFPTVSATACSKTCDEQRACKAWSFINGVCQLKSTIPAQVSLLNGNSGVKGTQLLTTSTYEFNTLRNGGVQTLKQTVSPGDCALLCDQSSTCKSWNWNNEQCYLQTTVISNVTSATAVSGVKNSIDWRRYGVVTSVKNQGPCGSCWAFSSVAALESIAAMKGYGILDLSEQQLVDCVSQCYGCNGGNYYYALTYTQNAGVSSEISYPYRAVNQQCANGQPMAFKNDGWGYVPYGNYLNIISRLKYQPVGVALCADTLQFYSGGVFSSTKPCPQVNHAVFAVGYTNDYWIIKNSWGTGWGEKGYFRLPMGNSLGIHNNSAFYPTKN